MLKDLVITARTSYTIYFIYRGVYIQTIKYSTCKKTELNHKFINSSCGVNNCIWERNSKRKDGDFYNVICNRVNRIKEDKRGSIIHAEFVKRSYFI